MIEADWVAEAPAMCLPPSSIMATVERRNAWGTPDDLKPLTRIVIILTIEVLVPALIFGLYGIYREASAWANRNLPYYTQLDR